MSKELNSKIKEFINNVMCRREHNQRKAHILWKDIKPHLKENDANLFETEWRGHYIHTGEHKPSDFSYWVETLINPYLK